ncbi:hypothetical protein VaNZ11_015890 [Volvox africanus]|uniref:Pseudouridine synthase I TruA alpha/beta domain-containing protein n=1 Tax=Volvox africanus TaxID=51714 RepID=A0ABQ5SLT2_9CHLO|nr:hypothetical protein VaNZ11_015890 [Volvox africanus]
MAYRQVTHFYREAPKCLHGDQDDDLGAMERVALVCGYDGAGYFGLQRQSDSTGRPTLEHELEMALVAVGALRVRDAGALHKVNWSRTSRTDKGVSAAANLVAMDLPAGLLSELVTTAANSSGGGLRATSGGDTVANDLGPLVQRLNEALPPAMRVLGAVRPGLTFDARWAAHGRRYEYLLPAWALDAEVGKRRGHPGHMEPQSQNEQSQKHSQQQQHVTVAETSSTTAERSRRRAESEINASTYQLTPLEIKRLNLILGVFVGSHCFHNFTSQPAEDPQELRRTIHRAYAEGPIYLTSTASVASTCAQPAAPADASRCFRADHTLQPNASSLRQAEPSPETVLLPQTQTQLQPHCPSSEGLPLSSARASVDPQANKPDDKWGAQHEHRNAPAQGQAGNQQEAQRPPAVSRNSALPASPSPTADALASSRSAAPTPYVRIVFLGCGFLMHQIRRMVGLALAVARRAAPPDCIRAALYPGRAFITVPTAPPTGLLMDRAFFSAESYRLACLTQPLDLLPAGGASSGDGNSSGMTSQSASDTPWQAQLEVAICAREAFKRDRLYPAIQGTGPLEVWSFLCGLTEAAYGFRGWTKMKQLSATSQGRARGQGSVKSIAAATCTQLAVKGCAANKIEGSPLPMQGSPDQQFTEDLETGKRSEDGEGHGAAKQPANAARGLEAGYGDVADPAGGDEWNSGKKETSSLSEDGDEGRVKRRAMESTAA